MEENFEIAKRIKPTMMKSSTQTYDIRDSEEFKGVFEIEVAIQAETNKNARRFVRMKFQNEPKRAGAFL